MQTVLVRGSSRDSAWLVRVTCWASSRVGVSTSTEGPKVGRAGRRPLPRLPRWSSSSSPAS